MKIDGRWVLALPLLSFALGTWYFSIDRTDLRIPFERGKSYWREGKYREAVELFLELQAKDPASERAAECLWEAATICYFNLLDVNQALFYFDRLVKEYPDSPQALDGHLKLAEIFEQELNEVPNALLHWEEALKSGPDRSLELDIRFRIAESRFRSGEFDLAHDAFASLAAEEDADPHLVHRALNRQAAILQIRLQLEEAVAIYRSVLDHEPCGDCRLQAQLSMVECLERLDRIEEAISTTVAIDPEAYPAELRDRLLQRLHEKRKLYEPGRSGKW